jgi:transmembrane sensor
MTDRPSNPVSPFGADLWDVLGRYVAGESPSGEAADVRRWLTEDPRRAELVSALERSLTTLTASSLPDVDVEAALHKVTARLAESDVVSLPERARARWRSMGLRAAAAVALLVGATLVWRMNRAGDTAPLTTVASRTYTTHVGQTDSVRLTDGTLAVLGPASRLEVVADYGAPARSVELQGVGFFEVVHDEQRPFSVQAGVARVSDLGTAFMVRNDGVDDVRVVVKSGSVLLQGTAKPKPSSAKNEKGVVLQAGDRGVVGSDGLPVAQPAAATDADLAWTRGQLLFDNASLARVRADIRRWYGVELKVDSTLANRHLTASFAGEPVSQVLDVIALTLGAKIERRGDTAVVRAR